MESELKNARAKGGTDPGEDATLGGVATMKIMRLYRCFYGTRQAPLDFLGAVLQRCHMQICRVNRTDNPLHPKSAGNFYGLLAMLSSLLGLSCPQLSRIWLGCQASNG